MNIIKIYFYVHGTRNYHILRICYSLSTTTTAEEEEERILKGLKKDLRDEKKIA
jgi:hypothetical protein